MHFDSFAEIWNKPDGFLSLLKVNDDGHDHEADQAEFDGLTTKLSQKYRGCRHHGIEGPCW